MDIIRMPLRELESTVQIEMCHVQSATQLLDCSETTLPTHDRLSIPHDTTSHLSSPQSDLIDQH